jgi:hypothetical protein
VNPALISVKATIWRMVGESSTTSAVFPILLLQFQRPVFQGLFVVTATNPLKTA